SEEPENFYHACGRLKIKMPAISADARQHFDGADRLSRDGRFDDAIAECGKAIAANAIFPEAFSLRAGAYVQKKQMQEATDDYSKAIEQNPYHRDYYIDRGNTRPRKDLKDYELAIADFGKAIELDPECAEAYDSRGECYRSQTKGPEALADFHKATELDPGNGEYLYHEALQLEDLLRKKEALADYNKYVELSTAQGAEGDFPRLALVRKRIAALEGAAK
ncbi:MAG: tetratricopeptide repeat protein, partial [Terriglobales bacterium]